MYTRGVKRRRTNDGTRIEVVCECHCHIEPNIKHCIACCGTPVTELGIEALKNYNKE
jgi:hypothetical protein